MEPGPLLGAILRVLAIALAQSGAERASATVGPDTLLQFAGLLITLTVAIAGAWRYLNTRARELSWKRTEFIFAQCQYIENDLELQAAVDVLEGRGHISAEQIFAVMPVLSDGQHHYYRRAFEKLFGLLDRLALAVTHSKSLTLTELGEFGYLFYKVYDDEILRQYCTDYGYPCLVEIAPRLGRHTDKVFAPREPALKRLRACLATCWHRCVCANPKGRSSEGQE